MGASTKAGPGSAATWLGLACRGWKGQCGRGHPARRRARGHLSAHVSMFCFCARSGMGSAPLDPRLLGFPWSSSPLQALLPLEPCPLPPRVLLLGPADGSLHTAPIPAPASLQVPPAWVSARSAREGRAVPGPSAATGGLHGPLADAPGRLVPRCPVQAGRTRGTSPVSPLGQIPQAAWCGDGANGPRAPHPCMISWRASSCPCSYSLSPWCPRQGETGQVSISGSSKSAFF